MAHHINTGVIGKEFPGAVLERVIDLDATELDDALGNLVGSEFVYEQQLDPEPLYAFKHPLTQEVPTARSWESTALRSTRPSLGRSSSTIPTASTSARR